MVVVALPPFWDFATSGLETALTYFWLALSWALLVRALDRPHGAGPWWTVLWLGLGPMIRPDMALVTVIFGLCLPGLGLRRSPFRAVALAAAALALPAAYQVFRMGYYGEVVPMPAITKSAGETEWANGLRYLTDFIVPYQLSLPLSLLLIALVMVLMNRQPGPSRARFLVGVAPILAALLSTLYVTRVGGDFMHARMLLPATFLIALPVFVVALERRLLAILTIMACWATVCAIFLRVSYAGAIEERGFIADEPGVYVISVGSRHPAAEDYRRSFEAVTAADPVIAGSRVLSGWSLPPDTKLPLAAAQPASAAFAFPLLGTVGAGIPLDAAAVDPLGLAYPLAAHMEGVPGGRPGQSKLLPVEWLIADYADPRAPIPTGISPHAVAAARAALSCGDLRELVLASRAPISIHQFITNARSAIARSSLTVPRDPFEAKKKFCG